MSDVTMPRGLPAAGLGEDATGQARPGVPLTPGSDGYHDAVGAWNLRVEHRPAVAFRARTTRDVAAAVRFARREGLGVGVMATGHGTPAVGPDGVLVNTSALRDVDLDPRRRLATVAAGVRWSDVHARSAPHGLVGVSGSSSQVGVVGYTQGGGFGWLSRRLGFASSGVRSAQLVTAEGEVLTLSARDHPELLWGVAAGGGNLGVVTGLTFDLHEVRHVYGGNLYYPLERAREVIEFYREWAVSLPVELMSALTFRSFPDAAVVPAGLRGRAFVAVRACHSGPDLRGGERLVEAARRALGMPAADTFAVLPATQLDGISMDPTVPLGAVQRSGALAQIDDDVIDALLEAAGPHSGSPFVMLELRQLGGALADSPRGPHPMARTDAAYTVNSVGLAPSPESAHAVERAQSRLFRRLSPSLTGTAYVNFLDGEETRNSDRVRAAYTTEDWDRLVRLKTEYDPLNTFRFSRTIPPAAAPAPTTHGGLS
ncbi:MAG: FAD-binding oxidoreductase [Dermatophilaceae bacterium]